MDNIHIFYSGAFAAQPSGIKEHRISVFKVDQSYNQNSSVDLKPYDKVLIKWRSVLRPRVDGR